ncbi:hypothetical protein FIBSPDRAFT_875333 [Athelia psychrophila]|uniref:Uncharacterized protein n=1 Tax=Athelia psychrophila TaxID=1759441 RepID=A0A165WFU0_9AGAM|nr:hypothetical protein FIBSPDRAFT_875333 [Fibularhizoctonia sp. CBS 109695]
MSHDRVSRVRHPRNLLLNPNFPTGVKSRRSNLGLKYCSDGNGCKNTQMSSQRSVFRLRKYQLIPNTTEISRIITVDYM